MMRCLRVLVAEDSPTARALLVEMLESDPEIRVVGQVASGDAAVREAERLRPDLITMDVHMPGLDGLEATRAIMSSVPTPILIVSALVNEDVSLSLEATRAGALLVLPKPANPAAPEFERERAQLVAMAKAMAGVKVVRRWAPQARPPRLVAPRASAARATSSTVPRVVAIGASTGGPAALRDVLAALPATFPVPIVVVQHIARGFVTGLARWLDQESALGVRVARAGDVAEPGQVYLAPDDRHLTILAPGDDTLRLALSAEPPVGAFRPSATALFESVARGVGAGAIAVILTGMGDDGVAGLRAVHHAGGRVLAQDEASSVIYGMPREAVRAGVVHESVPLGELANRLVLHTAAAGGTDDRA